MFKNMGKKIKVLAQVLMWIGFAMWCIAGLVMIANGVMMLEWGPRGIVMIVVGLIMIGLGFLFSWIGSFITYGFGQIIDNTDKLVALMEHQTGVTADSIMRPQPKYQQPQYGQPQYQPEYTAYAPENDNPQA